MGDGFSVLYRKDCPNCRGMGFFIQAALAVMEVAKLRSAMAS